MKAPTLFLSYTTSLAIPFRSSAFTTLPPPRSTVTHHPFLSLHAKSASKSKSGGGFGKSSPRQTPKTKESPVYPPLEPSVLDTLVPPPDIHPNGDILSEEIYDRLEAIHGLEKFNFGGKNSIYNSIAVAGATTGGTLDEISSSTERSLLEDLFQTEREENDSLDNLFGGATVVSPSASKATYDLNKLSPFEKFRVLHTDPMVLAIDDFMTPQECDRYIEVSLEAETNQSDKPPSPSQDDLAPLLIGKSLTVGKDSRSRAQRTSTTWFHYYEGVPELLCRASRLLGLEGIERWEEPQTVRYRRNEKFTWHLDALSPEAATDPSGAGQRVATLLVYLTDLKENEGGATMFRDLGGGDGPLKVQPKKGSALLFFPSAGGIPNTPFDIRTLHCGEAVADTAQNEKWIAQLWLCQRKYVPTAPEGNLHESAVEAMRMYCEENGS